MSDDTPFGEGIGTDAPRASGSVYVRRSLNDFTEYEEIFEFYLREPQGDHADPESNFAVVNYYITEEARTANPGVDKTETQRRAIPIKDVPGEVVTRAEKMVQRMWNGFMP